MKAVTGEVNRGVDSPPPDHDSKGMGALSFDSPPPWLRRKLRWARVVLSWEGAWRAGWPLASLAGLFLALALLDVLPRLPGTLHAVVLGGFAATGLAALVHGVRSFSPPGTGEAVRRLEANAPHRPLTALFDSPAGGVLSSRLWRVHVERMAVQARRLHPGWPKAVVPARDPLGLRAAVVLLLAVGVVVGGEHAGERLRRALAPVLVPAPPAAGASVHVWITPPSYTGAGPIVLGSATDPLPLVVPAGSALLAQVQGGRTSPVLEINGRSAPFVPIGETSHRLETAVDAGTSLIIRQGRSVLARWEMTVVPDRSPTAAFASPPGEGGRGQLRLSVAASDDYGIAAAGALMTRGSGTPVEIPLSLPGTRAKTVRAEGQADLTAHPWAGQDVELRPYARDGNGQTAVGEATRFRLPERVFSHPVARAIAQERKALAVAPERLALVLAALGSLSEIPETFGDDPVVYLGLRIARLGLLHDRSSGSVQAVRDLLWQLAVRLEDGTRADAEREVDDAGRALSEALSRGDADRSELETLIERYRMAVNRYLEALSRELAKLEPGLLPGGRVASAEDFGRVLDRMRELAGAGATDAARRMLQDLQRSMQELHAARIPRPGDEGLKMAREFREALKSLIDRQQTLLDDTFAQAQSTSRAVDRDRMRATARRQDALRRDLGEMMRRLADSGNDLPQGFGTAELAMREAVSDLERGDPAHAVETEGVALQNLKDSTRAALQRMIQRALGPGGATLLPGAALLPGADGAAGASPLGRHGGSMADDDGVRVPSRPETRNARRILDELRRRAGEQDRSPREHDYLNRLLRQF